MSIFIIVFISQICYMFIKVVGVRAMVSDDLFNRIKVTTIANMVWLITTSLGVSQMIGGNYLILVPYLLGSSVGVIIEHKFRYRGQSDKR